MAIADDVGHSEVVRCVSFVKDILLLRRRRVRCVAALRGAVWVKGE
jgi:hypothetical protein